MRKVNIAMGILFILFSSFIIISTMGFKQTMIVDSGLGAEFFPQVVAGITALISLILVCSSIKKKGINAKEVEVFNSDVKKPFLGMGLIILYVICLNFLGYLVSTIVFSFIFLSIFKVEKLITKVLVSVIFSTLIYFIFSNVFLINLPQGILI